MIKLIKKLLKRKLLTVTIIGFVFFAWAISYFVFQNYRQDNLIAVASGIIDNSLLPVRLKIPAIKVDTAVEYVGLTLDGAMDAPKGPAEVAWYKLGTRPGEIGSAVIAGHSGWKNNKRAVFDNLNKLQKGDKIYIEDGRGVVITFVVREKRLYNPNADATDVFSSTDGRVHLNLITCEGIWDEVTKSHPSRIVVFTDKE
ncbi:MAG: class F sortase [Candidatus Paceibacterota bacterium]